ncbi:MAG TPA: glycosyltransferase family A protein [Candidatus Saccharimonadales bacterium]|nr:glycosyltransferase family A protein [Candidatus Saccharimonadales bacterium]
MTNPLVSVIVTTRNNHATLDACLSSIAAQDYKQIELIVVDNSSSDDTKEIASRYTKHVYNKGPERSAQRNFAADKASGEYLLVIDSDMELGERVVSSCVNVVRRQPDVGGVIIPEESFGEGFWAQCKQLERSYYVGQDSIEAARFFRADAFEKAGRYSEEMTGGEDWDLSRRIAAIAPIARASEYIRHNEGRLYFGRTVGKMYYYAQHAREYFAKNPTKSALTDQSGPLARYKLFFSRPAKLLRRPHVGAGMLLLKTAEYAVGGLGYLKASRMAKGQS